MCPHKGPKKEKQSKDTLDNKAHKRNMADDVVEEKEPMDIDQSNESRGQQQKRQRIERQLNQPEGELIVEARKLWETVRGGDLADDVRNERLQTLLDLISGKIKDITFKHDMSRVVQTCLKLGNEKQRDQIAEELKGSYLLLSQSMYGRHILLRILKYCNRYRKDVVSAFYGRVRKMIRHKDASVVLEECYAVYASSQQRWNLVAEFFGNEFAVFKNDTAVRSLKEILEKSPMKRDTAMDTLKTTLVPLLQKGTVQHSLVHRALLEYLQNANEKERGEIIEQMHELCVEILHTREGAHATILCILHGSAKDRKLILRSMRPFLARIASEEYGHAVLIAILDCMDDTVFLGKNMLPDLCAITSDLVTNQYGRRVLLYILAGRNPYYVGTEYLSIMTANAAVYQATTKKNSELRHLQLTQYISESMINWVAENASTAIFDALPSQAVSETLLHATGEGKDKAWDAVLELINRDLEMEEENHVLLNKISNAVITTCIYSEGAENSKRFSSKMGLPELPENNPKYANSVLDALVESDQLVKAACAGSFPVRALLDTSTTKERARKLLKPHVNELKEAANNAEKPGIIKAILARLE
ncbi:Pumilio y domain member 6 [Coemansia sp. Benny D115]|nr:Pumilio y domain member 6 [Coemansia sp. Benny D115]